MPLYRWDARYSIGLGLGSRARKTTGVLLKVFLDYRLPVVVKQTPPPLRTCCGAVLLIDTPSRCTTIQSYSHPMPSYSDIRTRRNTIQSLLRLQFSVYSFYFYYCVYYFRFFRLHASFGASWKIN